MSGCTHKTIAGRFATLPIATSGAPRRIALTTALLAPTAICTSPPIIACTVTLPDAM
jgi:hypothetical protein